MSGKLVRRVLVSAGLTVLLLAAPAWAGARDHGPTGSFWSWLTSLWNGAVSAIWSGDGTLADPSGEQVDQGPGTDPNGGGTSAVTTPTSDQGPGTDPNGRP